MKSGGSRVHLLAPGHRRLHFLCAYDGADFAGWQSQAKRNSVQDRLEISLEKLCGQRVVVHGSGRTDAGVHALAQSAHVDVPEGRFEIFEWLNAVNAHLPDSVRVMQARWALPTFHARYSAIGKIYEYQIWNHRFWNPLVRTRTWHVPRPVDREMLERAARMLEGTHDFQYFAANRGKPVADTVRTINGIKISKSGPLIRLRFTGNGFLYKMVRLLTGEMVRCATGARPLENIERLIGGMAGKADASAPAQGLCLIKVLYGRR